MEARDGSSGFDFTGRFTAVDPFHRLAYLMDDERTVDITFSSLGDQTRVTETFDAEQEHSFELQKEGWQSILNNFKKYAETKGIGELLHFEKSIDADIDRVYQCMLDNPYYKDWTSVFNADSRFEGSWSKGSKILFLGTDKEGNMGGMVGRIRENIPGTFVSIEYTGILVNGEEKYTGPEVDQWAGGLENYSFSYYKSVFRSDFSGKIERFSDIPPSAEAPSIPEEDKKKLRHAHSFAQFGGTYADGYRRS
jgi:uncharacterized protein YndB with AHSA1/START domain